MKQISLLCLVLISCISCTHVSKEQSIVVDLNSISVIDPNAQIALMDLEWETELIPLQTTDESLVRDIQQLEETTDYFWIVSDRKVFQFGKDGTFQRQIGQSGQGPKEYIGVQKINIDEPNEEVYIMDYFGRKMVIFGWDGSFKYSFPLPEDYAFMDFYRTKKGEFYFYSVSNSVMPDILLFDPQSQQADTLSYRERQMGIEGFMGNTSMYEIEGKTYVHHYFNDTVYHIQNKKLHPVCYIPANKLTYRFDELEMTADFTPKVRPDGPRIQIDKVMETSRYIFVFYRIPDYQEELYKNFMAMYDKTDGAYFPHINIISADHPWLSIQNGVPFFYSAASNSLLSVKEPTELNEYSVIDHLQDDDNPVIIRYRLK